MTYPSNGLEAESRRVARFQSFGHNPGNRVHVRPKRSLELSFVLDLRLRGTPTSEQDQVASNYRETFRSEQLTDRKPAVDDGDSVRGFSSSSRGHLSITTSGL